LNCFKIDKAQRHHYSTFDVGRSMFDVHLYLALSISSLAAIDQQPTKNLTLTVRVDNRKSG
jgi:hypothetical protein